MKKLLVLIPFLLSVSLLFAQNTVTVTGKVTDATNASIPGVSVQVKGTSQGTITDLDGNYTIDAAPDGVLVFSFIGLTTQEIDINNRTAINVQMGEQSFDVDEVVVVGYGAQRVKDLTSSISTVKAEELVKSPSGQAMQALQGKVAGMQVVSSGAPGQGPTIRIRGVGSYPATDAEGAPRDTEGPLYVVDGMLFDDINFLNPADISTISVLKDASAAAIYGVRAANGVVLIETKSGQYNQKAQITYDGYYGYQIAHNVLQMANAEQFATMAMESGSAPDIANIGRAMLRYGRSRLNPDVPNVNTDWYKEIIRPAAIQNHSFDVSGGGADATYSLGTSYFVQEGILETKNEFERFNLRSKIDFKATEWFTMGGNVIFSNSVKFGPERTFGEENAAWSLAYWAVPILPVIDEQNTAAFPTRYASAQHIGYRSGQNPFPSLDFNHNRIKNKQILANFYMQVNLIPEKLTFKTTYNHNFSSMNGRYVDLPYFVSTDFKTTDASVIKRIEVLSNQIWDNVLNYTNSFGEHNLTLMAGASFRDDNWEMLTARGLNFPVDFEESWYIEQSDRANLPAADVHDNGLRQYGMSYFGRLAYNYSDRYLLYGTMRADGSSKYQEKWGYFPTFGVGWVISQEDFFADNEVVDFLKLRASWGQLGNNKIPASENRRISLPITTAIDDLLVSGTTTSSTFSALKWEVTEETNVGLTARVMDNRLSIEADYYIRDTKNAAIDVNLPLLGGTVIQNVGIIRNTGFELVLNWNDELAENFTYTIGANLSFVNNEVRDLEGQSYIDGGMAEFRQRSIVGEPILAFFGYEVLGVYQNQAEIQADPLAVAYNQANPTAMLVPGDFKYKNQNGDNLINDDDRVILGSYLPTFIYGMNLGLTYRNVEFSANVLGQSGNKILNRKRGEIIWTPDLNMDADLAKNRWHGEGTSNKYPSSAGLRKGWNQKMSDYFVEDGAFFRIQNIQLAYNIDGKELFGEQMPSARISLTAERPLTVFKYNGFNPEVPNGIDRQTYPIPGVYTIGLNVKF
ncbi:MAG TPA: TonB-dependent receptor [Prolixibacteraceae bacterium]|nr:TonB-dependent receptor [Prolixibacteraceae bacterium]